MDSPFSPAYIRTAIQDALSQDISIPAGHKGALVTMANLDRVDIALATKIKDQWSVELIGSHAWQGDTQLGVMSKLTW